MGDLWTHGPGDARTRAEEVAEHGLGSEHGGGNLLRNSPFLILSLVLHAVVFALLAYVTTRQPAERIGPEALDVEDMVEVPEEVVPLRRETDLAKSTTSSLLAHGPRIDEGVAEAVASSRKAGIEKPDILGLRRVAEGDATDFERMADDRFSIVAGKSEKTPEGAVDQFAIATLNAMYRGRTLVVLLVDQSRSIVYGDLPRVITRMDRYFDEIERNLPETIEERGLWVVVSYGRKHRFLCEPSPDLAYVKSALRRVTVDPSGEENIGLAIEAVTKRFGSMGYKNLLIAAMTDEAGDDINSPARLERALKALRSVRARFYVFGYESSFCARKKIVYFKLDPKIVRGADRAAIRGFENRTIWGWADGGPEAPRPELWWGVNRHHWAHWGGGISNIPSGFGMYGLNRLVLASHGIYFLLRPESKYDEDKLYAQYKPDVCNVFKYEERIARSALRRELSDTWREIGTFYMPGDLRHNRTVEDALRRSLRGRKYCIAKAKSLTALFAKTKPSGHNWRRWEAHTDLTMAELLRFRFMLGQYHARLRSEWTKHGRALPVNKRVLVTRGKAPADYMGAREAKAEHDLAMQYIERVINKHKGTPWEVAARRLKGSVFPWRCVVADLPGPQPPQPPRLAF